MSESGRHRREAARIVEGPRVAIAAVPVAMISMPGVVAVAVRDAEQRRAGVALVAPSGQ